MTSKIEWTDETWNPLAGCRKVSEGCRHCYAMRSAHRMASNPSPKIRAAYEGLTRSTSHGPEWTGAVRLLPERLTQPLRWRRPRRVFVNSMSDLFHEDVDGGFINAVFGVMAASPQHTFQLLTKRADLLEYWLDTIVLIAHKRHDPPELRGAEIDPRDSPRVMRTMLESDVRWYASDFDGLGSIAWPLPNVWLGVSVESADHLDRIEHLRHTPAAVRFVSAEPLLGDLGEIDLGGIDWVIAGAESGPGARPMNLDWVRRLRDQCVEQGARFFFKQDVVDGRKVSLPELDGRQWAEWPEVAP